MQVELKKNIENRLIEHHDEPLRFVAEDICKGGCQAGVSGFIWYSENSDFYRENRLAINRLIDDIASEQGENTTDLIRHMRGVEGFCREDIQGVLEGSSQLPPIANALVWVAVEEWANLFAGGES